MRKRNCRVEIYLTENELNKLQSKVVKAGMSREKFLRKLIDESRVYEPPPVDFYTLIREINRVGCNIDQILRLANTTYFIDAPRLRRELDALDKIEDAMWEAFAPDGR